MKLLKIGRSPSCDIVINSEYAGSHHADLTILDNGEIIIEDKGSKNGTFVGPQNRRINPGEEVTVRRGDLIRIADVELPWSRVPAPPKNHQYKLTQNIGSNFKNDITINKNTVSRYHATAHVDKKNNVFITDNGSTNGTYVNGVRIKASQPYKLKKSDNVVVGDEDITSNLAPLFPRNPWKGILIGIAACLAVVVLGFGVYMLVNPKNDPKDAVVWVAHTYHYEITPKDNPYKLPLNFRESDQTTVQGTAFFIDNEGRMGTAMHIAEPWAEEFSKEKTQELKKDWENYLSNTLPRQVTNYEELSKLLESPIGEYISEYAHTLSEVNAMLNTIFKSELQITGVSDDLRIGYPGRMYTNWEELDHANVVAKSTNPEADVAIIQLNTKKTPEKAAKVAFDMKKAYDKKRKIVPMKETFHTIGFPSGFVRSLDMNTKSLEPFIRESKVAKEPSRYYFELQDETAGGASGSPVYNENNELAGIIYAAFNGGANTAHVIKASYLQDLYNKEFGE